jgi:hypothetical protein
VTGSANRLGLVFRLLLVVAAVLHLPRRARCRHGRPVDVFNPAGIGGIQAASNIRWNRVSGVEDSSFWAEQAALMLRALLCAA